MSSKRPLQSNTVGNSFNGSKKIKQDFDNFKAPPNKNSSTGRPVLTNLQAPYQANVIRKIPIPPPASIVDKDYEALLDDDEDEVFILASQSTEEKFIQQRQMVSEQLNYSHNLAYNCFSSNAAGTSTQYFKSGYTEQIQQNLFEDFTAPSQVASSQRNGASSVPKPSQAFVPPPMSNPFVRPPLQVKAVPPKFPNAPVGSSQKENISTQQELTKQRNQIRALEIQLKKSKENVAELNLKSMDKNGEIANLRKEKKNLEEKFLKIKENDAIKVDPEKARLRKENLDLKTKLKFKSLNESSILKPTATVQQLEPTSAATLTNFNIESSSPFLPMSSKIFEVEEPLKNRDEPVIIALEREASHNVVKTQLKLARVYSNLLIGGIIDDTAVDSLFSDAACMILHIADFIEYLEAGKEDEIIFDSDVALTACSFISIPCFREKLTAFDPLLNTVDKDDGFLSVFQAEKLHPEELCEKPRRIVAIYAALARHSLKFSEKLLLDNVLSDDSDCFRTFVSVLVDSLLSGVTESKNIFDYFGLTIACASLLASLGSHYHEYSSSNNIIDDILFRLFRAVLECRCDSPVLMDHLSEFLVHITNNSRRTEIASKLCVNFPSSKIDISKAYKYSQYPFAACALNLFSSYLLSAFKFESQLNRHELELLLKITHNLNCVVANIKEMPVGTFSFLYWTDQEIPLCSCFFTLTYAILTLNYLALANRNNDFKQIVPVSTIVDLASDVPKLKKKSEFNEYHAHMSELSRGCITCVADLFELVDHYTDFPLHNLVFLGPLEQLCCYIKHGQCFDDNKNALSCWKAYDCDSYSESFTIMDIRPNYLTTVDNDESMEQSDGESYQNAFAYESCCYFVNDEQNDDPM